MERSYYSNDSFVSGDEIAVALFGSAQALATGKFRNRNHPHQRGG